MSEAVVGSAPYLSFAAHHRVMAAREGANRHDGMTSLCCTTAYGETFSVALNEDSFEVLIGELPAVASPVVASGMV